ncbi:PLP-dependent aminotransferase family protein [Geomonas nitrogeniifigens]|uniref:PLP-dependent aminotransferase family protein n=1 Tax=Geomonas diazotrophica TaxID=2843197 RepID=A0ABX8JIT4_9BACT|nr:PLP-dependent aminotransferase family protein [Geomonas nitrogeniifigens]QWV98300.1 PLP-dependent aminotransferase family protein [Geomonas nitrogeniifigens]QXE87484.1 PLP-dependent aminotransferase family protein [Geomonas nitrogeniifigens]
MFILNSSDPVPLYKQLYTQLREHILSGKLPANTRLPSVRQMAVELSASCNTVDGAYQELYAEGYIYSRPRSGYFVSPLDHEVAPHSLSGKKGENNLVQPYQSHFAYDFHPAHLDPESFPTELWRKCLTEGLRRNSREFSHYGDLQGSWGLRCSIHSYLEKSRGVTCDPDQIIVSAGLHQGLEIIAHLLQGQHTMVAVENPGYHLPRTVFQNHGYTICPVPVGIGGIELDQLKAGSATIAYVTPSHQLPLGYVMPVANRLALIEWAESGGRFIIEDDYDSELRYQGNPIPSLQGLRPTGNIIYSGTFSKILSPELRLSYLVLPYSLLARYRQLYRDYNSSVSLVEQRAMECFMEQGHWERHIRRMRTVYKKKHDMLLRSVETHFGRRAVVIGQGAGLHVVIRLPETPYSEAEIIDKAAQKGIRLLRFSDFHVTGHPEAVTLVLGFGGLVGSEIEQGIALLSQIC